MRILLGFLFVLSSVLFFGNSASAKEVTVNNSDELIKAVDEHDMQSVIKLSPTFKLEKNITLNINGGHKLRIIGNGKKLNRVINLKVNDYLVDLYLKNFNFDGGGNTPVGFKFQYTIDHEPDYTSRIYIEDSSFENSPTPVIEKEENEPFIKSLYVKLDNVFINNVKSDKSGAINFSSANSFFITDSTFTNNENSNSNIGGGALTMLNIQIVEIVNSVFEKNKLIGISGVANQLGGGAVFLGNSDWGFRLNVNSSIFKENETNLNDNQNGGAIFLKAENDDKYHAMVASYSIGRTVFEKNKSSGYGGAIASSMKKDDAGVIDGFRNCNTCIFYNNEVNLKEDKIGGGAAIADLLNYKDMAILNGNRFTLSNSTFVKNSVVGGRIKENQTTVLIDNKANKENNTRINIAKTIFGFNIGDANFKNINTKDLELMGTENIGIDNGSVIIDESKKIFGKYKINLQSNYNELKAGYSKDRRAIPSIMIIPKFTNNGDDIVTGIANEKIIAENIFEMDFRGYFRGRYQSLGAVETTSILYDANGGYFKKEELKSFNGRYYYEGANPTQYASLYLPMSTKKIQSGLKDLNIYKKGSEFIGWSTNYQNKVADSKYKEDKTVKLDKQLKLYAIWRDLKVPVRFYSNGKTSGSLSTTFKVKPNSEITIPTSTKIKRKGYKFSGWSFKPNSTKPSATIAPGKKIKITKAMNIYAVWKK